MFRTSDSQSGYALCLPDIYQNGRTIRGARRSPAAVVSPSADTLRAWRNCPSRSTTSSATWLEEHCCSRRVDLAFFDARHVMDNPSVTGAILAILAAYITST